MSAPSDEPTRGSMIVVGAGLSGLAAAWRLQRAGVAVTVLEPRPVAGGRVRSERVGNYLVDTGPDAATAGYERWLALADDVGLSAGVAPTSAVIGTVRDGRVIDIDPARPLRAAMTPALSAGAKARMGIGLLRLRRKLASVDSYELSRSAALDDPATTAYAFAQRYFGREVADYLIDGAMRLVSGSGAREASCLGVLGALTGWSTPTINIRGGLQSVPDAVAARLHDLRLGATATHVAQDGDGVTVTYADADAAEHAVRADGCVIATMYHTAREIWPELDPLAPSFGPRLKDVKLISISLGYRVRPANRAYIVSVPTIELPDVLLMFMQHNKAPDRAPAGHALITLYTDTLATDRYLAKSDEELEAWAASVVEGLCPELAGQRDMGHTARWPKAGYLADPGFWRRSGELLAAIPPRGRVQLAGDLFGAGSMESSVRWGERAADRLLARATASQLSSSMG
jgi:oxygen-dependent protoporphyrinogen oxidase